MVSLDTSVSNKTLKVLKERLVFAAQNKISIYDSFSNNLIDLGCLGANL